MNAPPFGSSPPGSSDASAEPPPGPASVSPDSLSRRASERMAVTWSVDCRTDDTFLYASLRDISELGVFVATLDPLPVGTTLSLRFAPPGPIEPFMLMGRVQWINSVRPLADNPNPGMGVRFLELTSDARERLVEAIHTIAYVRYDVC